MTQATITWALGILVTGIPAIYGAGTWADGYVAKQSDLVLIGMQLEQKIEADRLKDNQARLWQLADRYPDMSKAPVSVQEEYRQLKRNQEQSQFQLNGIQNELNEKQVQRAKGK